MKRKTRNLLSISGRLLCLILAFSLFICILPATAADEAEVSEDGEQKPATVSVVRMVKDAPRGTKLTKEYLEVVEVKNLNIPSNIISSLDSVKDKYAATMLYAGEYVSPNQITTKEVQKADTSLLVKPIVESDADYLIVTDYVIPNTGKDVSVYLQEIFDKNGGRTIYFPDGEYVISRSLLTDAAGKTSTTIQLADGAVIKAASGSAWKAANGNALIILGGGAGANDINSVGSYYSVMGGTLDCGGVTNGITIRSGRETVIRNLIIKTPKTGILIERGANNGSSDCDFEDIAIVGEGRVGTTGIEVVGFDNTFTNIRIYNMGTGIVSKSGGNLYKSIYVFNDPDAKHVKGGTRLYGFRSTSNDWISDSHMVNCTTAFGFENGSEVWDCTASWTTSDIKAQTVATFAGNNLTFSGVKANYCMGAGVVASFVTGDCNVKFIEACSFDESVVNNKNYEKYMVDGQTIIPVAG